MAHTKISENVVRTLMFCFSDTKTAIFVIQVKRRSKAIFSSFLSEKKLPLKMMIDDGYDLQVRLTRESLILR